MTTTVKTKARKLSDAIQEADEKVRQTVIKEHEKRLAEHGLRAAQERARNRQLQVDAMIPMSAVAVCWHYKSLVQENMYIVPLASPDKREITIERVYDCIVPLSDVVFEVKKYQVIDKDRGFYSYNANGRAIDISIVDTVRTTEHVEFRMTVTLMWAETYYTSTIDRVRMTVGGSYNAIRAYLYQKHPHALNEFSASLQDVHNKLFYSLLEAEEASIMQKREKAKELEKAVLSIPSMLEVIARGDDLNGN